MKTRGVVAYILSLAMLLPLAPSAGAATLPVQSGMLEIPGINLGTSQVGNADTTNTIDRGNMRGPGLLKVTTTVGGSPTVTLNIMCSMDNANFWNCPYALPSTPETVAVAAIVITSATTNFYILRPFMPWRYLKVTASLNTNVTYTIDAWASLN